MNGNSSAEPDYSILSAFQGPIVRPRASFLYQLSLLFVTLVMVLLPLVYFALVSAVAYGIWYHAVHHWVPLMNLGTHTRARGAILLFIIYVTPIFVGLVVLFFMVKPLLAGRPRRAQPLALNPSTEPLLYAFVEKICETVGAPSPKRIDLDCEVNAAAGFRRGFLSFLGNDLVLTIGLPLVANFTAREFAGVVAHEFGHFSQGVAMRLSYITRNILGWFGRVAYERDAWDVWLEYLSLEAEEAWVTLLLGIAQLGIWSSRLILKILLFIGVFFCGFLLRQMEYNADAYEVKVAGSEGFERSMRKFATLAAAQEMTHKQLDACWKTSKQLPDNLAELIRRNHEQLPPAVAKKIDDTLGFERTGFFDSHPSAADRIRQARRAADPGFFLDERPASSLFSSFDHPARFVTMLHYTDDLDLPITPEMLIHVKTAQSKSSAEQAAAAPSSVRDEYFLGILPLLLPLQISQPIASTNHEADAAELTQLCASLQRVTAQLAPIASQYAEATRKRLNARTALRLMEALVPVHAAAFGLSESRPDAARASEAEAVSARDSLRHSVHEVASAVYRRLQLALSLRLGDRGDSGLEPISVEQFTELIASLNQFAGQYAQQLAIMEALAVRDRIVEVKNEEGETPMLEKALTAQTEFVASLVSHSTSAAADSTTPKPQLQIARRPSHINEADIEALQAKTLQWLADYQNRLEELAEISRAAETVPA